MRDRFIAKETDGRCERIVFLAGSERRQPMTEGTSEHNPSWTRDELILALELYRRHQGNPPGKNCMKVMKFRRFDLVYLSQEKRDWNKLEAEIWNTFADKQSLLANTAAAIRANI